MNSTVKKPSKRARLFGNIYVLAIPYGFFVIGSLLAVDMATEWLFQSIW